MRILLILVIFWSGTVSAAPETEELQQLTRIYEFSQQAIGTRMDSQTYTNIMSSTACALGFAIRDDKVLFEDVARKLILVMDHIIVSGYAATDSRGEWSAYVKKQNERATNMGWEGKIQSPADCVSWGYKQRVPEHLEQIIVEVK